MMPELLGLESVRGKHLLVALSGGADSTALLALLCANSATYNLRITAAHLNHMIRGAEADADEMFCRTLCARLGINLIRHRINIPQEASERGIGLETCARDARYRFLRAAMTQCGADLIATAHHANDQVETILMHLFRGTGPEGITGMRVFSGDLYRPLLELQRDQLRDYLRKHGIPWREDSTNSVADNPRNKLRLNVIPEIESIYPGAHSAILRFARTMCIENDTLTELTDEYLRCYAESYPYGTRLSTDPMPSEAVLRRAIHRLCGLDISFEKIEEVVRMTGKQHGKTDFSNTVSIERTPSALWLINKHFPHPDPVPVVLNSSRTLTGIAEIVFCEGEFPICPENPMTESIDLSRIENACIRTRMPGDRIHPLGAPGSRLLSDCLTDRKIERPIRDQLPLIAVENRVLWCLGVGISEELKITPQTGRPGRLDIRLLHSEVQI